MKRGWYSVGAVLILGLGTAWAGSVSVAAAGAGTVASPGLPDLDIESYRLDNGLTVLLDRTTRLPVVAVEVRYLVGSAYEREGRSGFAHLFEHLMFQGSKNFDQEYFAPFEPVGGAVNGSTSQDRTNYFERVPDNHLELALWMESERMQNLLGALTQAKLDNQRDVVKNERRQRYENEPYGMARIRLAETLFPQSHPYHGAVIGSHEDLSAASLDDVRQFFAEYYVPANAVLTVSGSFEPDRTKRLIAEYFGPIPGGQRALRPNPEPPRLDRIVHVTTPDDVKLPRIYFGWHTPALYAPGDAELDLWASVLTDGKTSRLFRPLVYERKVATSVSAEQVSHGLSGFFVVQATASPGVDAQRLGRELARALDAALGTPPTAEELERALNGYRKRLFSRLEGVLERAQLLSTYYHFAGKADYLQQDLARYVAASQSSVHSTARQWLPPDRYARVDVIPAGSTVSKEPK